MASKQEKPPLKVAIVGTCPSSKMLAPYGDPSWTIWACGPDNVEALPRIDAWFEIHGDLCLPGAAVWERSYVDWVNAHAAPLDDLVKPGTFTLYVQDLALFPGGTRLPFEKLKEMFSTMFFTSSAAWMFAHALAMGAQQIGLYGLDMSARSEYLQQRPAMQHFIWFAGQKGVEVTAPAESDILAPPPLYGFERSSPYGRKLEVRRREVAGRVNALDAEMAAKQRERDQLAGALDDIDYHQTIWTGDRERSASPERHEP